MRADASLISLTRPSASSTVTMSGQARMTVSSSRWRSASAVSTWVHSVMSVAMAAMPVTVPASSRRGNRTVIRVWGPSASIDDVVAGEGLAAVEHARSSSSMSASGQISAAVRPTTSSLRSPRARRKAR